MRPIKSKTQNHRENEYLRSELNVLKNKIFHASKPLAVICFYNNKVKEENNKIQNKRFDPKRLRLLLLLKNDIQNFINHHLQNDSFVDFVNGEKKRKEIEEINKELGKKKQKIDEKNIALKNAIKGYNHNSVEPAFVLLKRITLQENQFTIKDKVVIFKLCSNIIVSDIFNTINLGEGDYSCKEYFSPLERKTNQLIDNQFYKIICRTIKGIYIDFDYEKNLKYQVVESELKRGINIYHFRAFIILLLNNIKKHLAAQLTYTRIGIYLDNKKFVFFNTYRETDDILKKVEEFNMKKESIFKYEDNKSENTGMTHPSFFHYFKTQKIIQSYNIGFVTINNGKIVNSEKFYRGNVINTGEAFCNEEKEKQFRIEIIF